MYASMIWIFCRFMVGTETGLVIGGNRKGKTPLEKLPSKVKILVLKI